MKPLAATFASAVLAALQVAPAAQADEAGADRRSLYAGMEVGNHDTRRIMAGASLRWVDLWQLDLQLARASVDIPGVGSSSTLASAQLQYDFGKFGAGLGWRRGEFEDVSATTGWSVIGNYDRGTLRYSLEVETRHTQLDPSTFSEDLGGSLGLQTGISRCEVDSRGYQAQVDLDRPSWLGYLSYKLYDYQDFDCALTLDGGGNGNGPPAQSRGRALGRRLSERVLGPARGFTSRLVPREAMLLDSSLALGVTLPIDERWIGGTDVYRDLEQADGGTVYTAVLFASRRLSEIWGLELSLGFSAAQGLPDTAFAGIRMSAEL